MKKKTSPTQLTFLLYIPVSTYNLKISQSGAKTLFIRGQGIKMWSFFESRNWYWLIPPPLVKCQARFFEVDEEP